MAPYDDWVKVEDEDDEELQDYSAGTPTGAQGTKS
jgi:hypothetical protein